MGDEAEYLNDAVDLHTLYMGESIYEGKKKLTRNGLYRCTRCGQYKPRNEFYADNRVPCGIRNRCKKCYHK